MGVTAPPAVELAMAVNPVSTSEETWRVVVYRPDGSFFFWGNRSGPDWKTRRNAEKEAASYNAAWSRAGEFAVVRRVRVTVEEIEEKA